VPGLDYAFPWIEDLAGMELKWPDVFYYFIMPYIATTFIIFGLFEEIGIFRRIPLYTRHYLYAIISIAWAATLIPTGLLGSLSVFLYQAGAVTAIIIFFIAFLGGGLVWAFAFRKTAGGGVRLIADAKNKMDMYDQQIIACQQRLGTDSNYTRKHYDKDLAELILKRKFWETRYWDLTETITPEKEKDAGKAV